MQYQFVTIWAIEAPLETVCEMISQSLDWPQWWPGAVKVEELAAGDTRGVGNVRRYTWRGRLPYRLTFNIRVTHIEPKLTVDGIACGDVEGWGRWSFASEGPVTIVRYDWQVHVTRARLRWLGIMAGPLIRWNHDGVMRQGGQALARTLNARLVQISHH